MPPTHLVRIDSGGRALANSGRGRPKREPAFFSGFIDLPETETDRQQLVLLPHRPRTRKAEPFAQRQHGCEPVDCPSCRVKGLNATESNRVKTALDPQGMLNPGKLLPRPGTGYWLIE